MIGIIDYGLGNIKAISNIYDKLKIKNIIIRSKDDFEKISSMILPGVGSFDSAINLLIKSKYLELIKINVHEKKKKYTWNMCRNADFFSQKFRG